MIIAQDKTILHEVLNNNIFLAGDDTLGYLAGTVHKKYSMTFIRGHPFSSCEY